MQKNLPSVFFNHYYYYYFYLNQNIFRRLSRCEASTLDSSLGPEKAMASWPPRCHPGEVC